MARFWRDAVPDRFDVERAFVQSGDRATLLVKDCHRGGNRAVLKLSKLDGDVAAILGVLGRLGRINSPHAEQVYAFGPLDQARGYFYARAYTPGVSLAQARISTGYAELLRQLLEGVGAFHSLGVVHGDVKPDNVIVQRLQRGFEAGAHCVIIDPDVVGAASNVADEFSISYVAPEVVGGGTRSAQQDIYAVAATMFWAVCGVAPFVGDSFDAVSKNQRLRKYACPLPSGWLGEFINLCLDPDPNRRPVSAQDALSMISRHVAPRLSLHAPRSWIERCEALAGVSMELPTLEIQGAPRSGVSHLLADMRDCLDRNGVQAVLVFLNQGQPLVAQLCRLLKKNPASHGLTAALDVLAVPEYERSVTVVVDDWHLASARDRQVIRAMVAGAQGAVRFILGTTDPEHPTHIRLSALEGIAVQACARPPTWSSDELVRACDGEFESSPFSRRALSACRDRVGEQPGHLVEALRLAWAEASATGSDPDRALGRIATRRKPDREVEPSYRPWEVVREAIKLLRSGRLSEVTTCIAEKAGVLSSTMHARLALAVRAFSGKLVRSDSCDYYHRWLVAEGLSRARYHQEAHEILMGLFASRECHTTEFLTRFAAVSCSAGDQVHAWNALRTLRTRRGVDRACLWGVLGRLAYSHRRFELAVRAYSREARIRERTGNKWALAACLNNLAAAKFSMGLYDEANRSFEASAELREGLEDERGLAATLANKAAALSAMGRFDVACASVARSVLIARRNDLRRLVRTGQLNLGMAHAYAGRLGAAARVWRQLRRESRQDGDKRSEHAAVANLARVELDCWRVSRFQAYLKVLPESLALPLRIESRFRVRDGEWLREHANASPDYSEMMHVMADVLDGKSHGARHLDPITRIRCMRVRARLSASRTNRLIRLCLRYGARREALEWAVLGFNEELARSSVVVRLSEGEGHDDLAACLCACLAKSHFDAGLDAQAIPWVLRTAERIRLLRRGAGFAGAAGRAMAFVRMALEIPEHSSIDRGVLDLVVSRLRAGAQSWPLELLEELRGDDVLQAAAASLAIRPNARVLVVDMDLQVLAASCADVDSVSWSTIEEVIRTNSARAFEDAMTTDRLAGRRSISRNELRSIVCTPIRCKGKPRGVVYFDTRGDAVGIGPADERRCRAVAELIGVRWENADLEARLSRVQSDAKTSRAAIMRTQILAVAGELAAGVVHDLRNVLCTIVARAQIIRLRSESESSRNAKLIEDAARMAESLVTRIQDLGKSKVNGEKDTSLPTVMEDVAALTHHYCSDAVELAFRVPADGRARCDGGALRAILLNLVVNATQAVGEAGRVVVEAQSVGSRWRISVSDDGCGMPPEVLERARDPFFTTKGDSGTGMGLAIVQTLVADQGGQLEIKSEAGSGTVVSFEVPKSKTGTPAGPLFDELVD